MASGPNMALLVVTFPAIMLIASFGGSSIVTYISKPTHNWISFGHLLYTSI